MQSCNTGCIIVIRTFHCFRQIIQDWGSSSRKLILKNKIDVKRVKIIKSDLKESQQLTKVSISYKSNNSKTLLRVPH